MHGAKRYMGGDGEREWKIGMGMGGRRGREGGRGKGSSVVARASNIND